MSDSEDGLANGSCSHGNEAHMYNKYKLEHMYRTHHERGRRYGYLYCHGERGLYLKPWIGTGKKILDLGCRDGELTKFYLDGNSIKGVDIDRNALVLAATKYSIDTEWIDLNTEFISEHALYDVVVACEIIEHIYNTDNFLKNIYECLTPGGLFVGSVPNSFRFRNRLKFLFGKEFETDPTHVHMFSFRILSRILDVYFENIEIIPLGGKILPFLKVSRNTPIGLNRLFGRDLLFRCNRRNND
jgi:SAM-dependent methyltransferase